MSDQCDASDRSDGGVPVGVALLEIAEESPVQREDVADVGKEAQLVL
jgi:hypothetical protein